MPCPRSSPRLWLAIRWLLAGAVLWAGRPAVLHGQTEGWRPPQLISLSGQFAWFPDIAVDMAGQVHVVYASGTTSASRVSYDSVMYVTSPTGESWTSPNDIFSLRQPGAGESAATRPTLLVDSRNQLHVAFTDYTQIFYSQTYASDAVNARAWAPDQLLGSGSPAYFSRLLEDGAGRLHVFLTENVFTAQCQICYHVYHRFSDDFGRTWSPPTDVSGILGAVKPQAAIDDQGNLYLVWDSGTGGSLGQLLSEPTVRFTASYDHGLSWEAPLEFKLPVTDTATTSLYATIAVDGKQQVVMTWLAQPSEEVYFQVSADRGRTWSSPAVIPGVWSRGYATGAHSMLTDGAGNVHLAIVGRRTQRPVGEGTELVSELIHLAWDGTAWAEPEVVVAYRGDLPEWPRMAVKFGNELHLTWFLRNARAVFGSDASTARYAVYYSRRTLDNPEVKPAVVPTKAVAEVTATPAPEAATLAAVTPTAVVVLPALTPGPAVEEYRENDYLLIAAQSLLPVVVLLGAASGVIWWRRRQR